MQAWCRGTLPPVSPCPLSPCFDHSPSKQTNCRPGENLETPGLLPQCVPAPPRPAPSRGQALRLPTADAVSWAPSAQGLLFSSGDGLRVRVTARDSGTELGVDIQGPVSSTRSQRHVAQ